jgi:hypothetical protein
LPVHDQNARTGTGEQDGGCSTIADAVTGGAATGDYGYFALEAKAMGKF